MQSRDEYPGSLAELTTDECWAMLRDRPFGRVAWSGPDGIHVIPVNYVVRHATIVLRTTPYSLLAQRAGDLEVAFEVDRIDENARSGWSVVAQGRCRRADIPAADTPEPWADGTRVLALQIDVRSISGRRLRSHFEPA